MIMKGDSKLNVQTFKGGRKRKSKTDGDTRGNYTGMFGRKQQLDHVDDK